MDYQAAVRYGDGKALAIIHAYEHEGKQEIVIPLEAGYDVCDIYQASDHGVVVKDGQLKLTFDESFDAVALLLEK